jgi:hypothetical protein
VFFLLRKAPGIPEQYKAQKQIQIMRQTPERDPERIHEPFILFCLLKE